MAMRPNFGKKVKYKPWHGYLALVVIGIALVLGVVQKMRGIEAPTSAVPAVGYEEVQEGVEEGEGVTGVQEGIAVGVDPRVDSIEPEPEPEPIATPLPAQINLAVPFTSQAPKGDWGLPYQEACEETAAYMVAQYYTGTPAGKIDADVADTAILDIVDFEQKLLGQYFDTTAAETSQLIEEAYNDLEATVIENPTVEQIKAEVAAGRPVIVPAAGRELGNPFFSGEGPLYHMIVIKGYGPDTFIANDPGTRLGENYTYDIDVIMDAMGDWNDGDPATGAKRVIFVSPR